MMRDIWRGKLGLIAVASLLGLPLHGTAQTYPENPYAWWCRWHRADR